MNHSISTKILLLLLFPLLAAPKAPPQGGNSVTRDWAKFPAIVTISAPKHLYALGDVHGDYDRLVQLLAATRIIDGTPASPEAARWSAGKAVLVCTGDLIDKYDQGLRVIAMMRTLQQSAADEGGQVIVTLGNHEAEFLAGQGDDKKAVEFSGELKKAGISPMEVSMGGDGTRIGAWLRSLPAGARVGDWFFCHAGNTGGKTLEQLNSQIELEVGDQGWGAPILSDPNSMLEARMHPRPWWDWDGLEPTLKDLGKAEKGKKEEKENHQPVDEGSAENRLRKMIEALGAKHLVFGHQPGKVRFLDGTERPVGQMFTKYNGLVFMIDTGMSRGVQSGRGALLLIEPISKHPSATAIYADGSRVELWR